MGIWCSSLISVFLFLKTKDLSFITKKSLLYQSTRKSYYYEPHGSRNNADDNTDFESLKLPQDDFEVTEIAIHPRHRKLIKSHQMEGFDFLVKNLVSESPSGCILAHAPGSGKTFMLIAFIQSFLAKYPSARPLVILPKGILPTWKRELQRYRNIQLSY